MRKIKIYGVTLPRNEDLAGVTGYIVNVLVHEDSRLPVYMVQTPSGRIAPVSEDFEDFTIFGRCTNCDQEVDVETLSDDFYEECLDCVEWFNKRQLEKASGTLAKLAMVTAKKGRV